MDEDKYISPGDRKAMFPLSFGQAGMIICYDLRFTELSRALAREGCFALFVAGVSPSIRGVLVW